MVDKRDPTSYAKYLRNTPEVERALRETHGYEGARGNSENFKRRHEFSFSWSQEDRDVVNKLMQYGMSFDEAFDYFKALPKSQRP